MTRGCGSGSKSKYDGSAGSAPTDPANCRRFLKEGSCHWETWEEFCPLLDERRDKSLHMDKQIHVCVCVHTHMYMDASKSTHQRAVALRSFLLFGLLCSLIPFKVNLVVVHLKTIPILCCLPHTRSTPFLSNSCLTSQLVLQKLSPQLPDISIQELPSGTAAHFHVGLTFVFAL